MLQVETHLRQDPGQLRVLDLCAQDAERAHHRQSRVHHGRQLAGHDGDFAQFDPVGQARNLDLGLQVDRRFRRHGDGHVAHLSESTDDQRHAVAVELSFDELAALVAYLVVECQCHGSPIRCSVVRSAVITDVGGCGGPLRLRIGRRRWTQK